MFRGFAVLGLLSALPRQSLHSDGRDGRLRSRVPDGHRRRASLRLSRTLPSKAPLASNVKFTEQAQVLEVGGRPLEDHDTGTDGVQDRGGRPDRGAGRHDRDDEGRARSATCQSNHWHRAACSARSGGRAAGVPAESSEDADHRGGAHLCAHHCSKPACQSAETARRVLCDRSAGTTKLARHHVADRERLLRLAHAERR